MQKVLRKFIGAIKRNENKIVLVCGFAFAVCLAFGLGFLWRGELENKKEKLKIKEIDVSDFFNQVGFFGEEIVANKAISEKETEITAKKETMQAEKTEKNFYVASKNGKAYHLPNCPGAKRIKEENLIKFQTKKEAEEAGYKPALNCKGL